uniref:Eukaryotic translation initiation factor 4E nuclear import factor 1 n=1 Tax=Gouania willdenowi TaxID=441366 RepID=A0A8C5HIL3_GOUWI
VATAALGQTEVAYGDSITLYLLWCPSKSPHRYTKEKLLEIKDLPISNERPECLSEKYDSEGVWDPEKWHASLYPTSERSSPVDGFKKEYVDDRVPLKRRIPDPRERLKEDDLDVVLSPQRRSFGGGCQGNAAPAPLTRRPISPLENKENESMRLGGARRIGSGRIIAARAFEREARAEKERERERDFKDKRFRRDFGDKRVFSERRRNDSYAEEEPEWFSGGPTSQSETIELIGFDDKILEDDKRRSRRSRKRTDSLKEGVECNGGQVEAHGVGLQSSADQEVPHPDVLPEQSTGDFDFNEFFNLEKTMPGLASMIEDVLGEGPVSASRFSQWFSSNLSPSGSRSSSLRSTPHEELEKLGLDACSTSSCQGPGSYFTPIASSECKEKVDILELLHKAKIDLKPLLSTLSVNKAHLRESTNSGVALSLAEVEGDMKGMKLVSEPQVQKLPPPQRGNGTPFMAEHLEEALTGGLSARPRSRDTDMSAFNKLVNCMKASGTLPALPKAKTNNVSTSAIPVPSMRTLSMPISQAELEALAFQQDLALNAHQAFQSGYNKQPMDKSFRNRFVFNVILSSTTIYCAIFYFQLSPSFTPTSVIRKMYATKDKSRDEPSGVSEGKDELTGHSLYYRNSTTQYLDAMDGSGVQPGRVKTNAQTVPIKDQERLRPGCAGHSTPTMIPHGPASFPRPLYPIPLIPHVPMVRPPQLHPSIVQRMLAQGIQPQQLGPALVQAGLPPALLGQPLYPVPGHSLLPPGASAQMQLAVMQQQLQQQRPIHPGMPSQNQGSYRANGSQRHSGSPTPGLAKWFGSDVLEQPLPSMPAKVISVDELEFRP